MAEPLPVHSAPPQPANAYVYMIPFTFSCAVLTLAPLLAEFWLRWNGHKIQGGLIDPAALRPLALLTGAAYAFVLLLRGFMNDFQVITLVALVLSLITAMMSSLTTGIGALDSSYGLPVTINTMSTFIQGTFFAAAAVAGWLAPDGLAGRAAHSSRTAAHSLLAGPPPRFLVHVLSLLALAHFILPIDMMLQSTFLPNGNANGRIAMHEAIRIGIWCLAAVWLVIGALRILSRPELDDPSAPLEDRTTPPSSPQPPTAG